ncbi:MAG: cyclase family protein [Methanomicrobiales archaeon]|nr:cyclase family protein [Methanomicrobiales archaeon]
MKIIDITRPLSEAIPLYPGDVPPVITPHNHGTYLTTDIHLSSHHGTHIDAPLHFLPGGLTVDSIPLQSLIGPCLVLDRTQAETIMGPELIIPYMGNHTRLLLRTVASGKESFGTEFPCIRLETARALAERGLTCIGIDSPSIEEYAGDGSVHKAFLSRNIPILEFLDLSRVNEGLYQLIALPMRLQGREGAPVRAILCPAGEEL